MNTKIKTSSFKAAIFDMDGLLIDSEPVYLQVWKEASKECGYEISKEEHRRIIGKDWNLALKIINELADPNFDTERLPSVVREKETLLFAKADLQLKPGAIEILTKANNLRIPCALATSTKRIAAEFRIAKVNLGFFFKTIVCGDDVKNGKPSPDIFLKAASDLGVNPGDCIVFEDSPAGIEAANKAGMLPCFIPDQIVIDVTKIAACALTFSTLNEAQEQLFG